MGFQPTTNAAGVDTTNLFQAALYCHCEPLQRNGVRNLPTTKNAPNDYCRRVGFQPTNATAGVN
ncbi:MAG: hypothetical protein II131_00315 [Neisseriaceae bacterium]|nr:hypothetical protein [Neisseriaceae bacterium]